MIAWEIACRCCRRPCTSQRRYLCRSCYLRWLREGKPEAGPSLPAFVRAKDERAAACRLLLARGYANRDFLAQHLGVSTRTVRRYIAVIRKEN